MKILHYALGFSPYRSGGLTRYVEDLMNVQKKEHEVGLLWPGAMTPYRNKIRIKKKMKASGIISYEMINPLPVPLLEGVRDIPAYMREGDKAYFLEFLQKEKLDIIHVHSFMGLYAEFLEAAKQLGIKTVFTTHDHYAICPTVNMLCKGSVCKTGMSNDSCSNCDMNPLSLERIVLLQSPLYRLLKESSFVKNARKKWAKDKQNVQQTAINTSSETEDIQRDIFPYNQLKEYYQNMLKMITVVHCNSNLTKEAYFTFSALKNCITLPISNQNIVDKRFKKVYNKENAIRITYIGSASEYKGYFCLVKALDELNKRYGDLFELHVYAPVLEKRRYIIEHDAFVEDELDSVLARADLLVAPSICRETFGFVVLEALSRGVPVIVSTQVGAKDLVEQGKNGLIVTPDTEALQDAIESILCKPEILADMNEYILQMDFPYTMEEHAEKLFRQVYS